MTVSDLISILQKHDPNAVVVVSMCPGEGAGYRDAVTVERSDVCAVQLLAASDVDEYRNRYEVVAGGGMPGVWLG